MNISTITRPLALIAVGALALAGCAAAEPTPVKTVYVTAEPAPAVEDDWLESDDFIQLVLKMAWADIDAETRESICLGIDLFGEDWFAENWDEELSGAPAPLAFEFFEEKCS